MSEALIESTDPRVARTRRDVVTATSELLLAEGWEAVSHAEVARRSGYAKATIYAHWPTQLDLVRASIDQICSVDHHPETTGDLRADLRAALVDFAHDLSVGHLDRLLAGVVERAHRGSVIDDLRKKLYETGTRSLRAILETHLDERDVDSSITLLTGGVLVRVAFEGREATTAFIDDLIERVVRVAP
jgi:AcrR family transcriptional regulator